MLRNLFQFFYFILFCFVFFFLFLISSPHPIIPDHRQLFSLWEHTSQRKFLFIRWQKKKITSGIVRAFSRDTKQNRREKKKGDSDKVYIPMRTEPNSNHVCFHNLFQHFYTPLTTLSLSHTHTSWIFRTRMCPQTQRTVRYIYSYVNIIKRKILFW